MKFCFGIFKVLSLKPHPRVRATCLIHTKASMSWNTQSYIEQKKDFWPKTGKHILAQFDDESIVVYQAFNPEIAKYAVDNQKFGGERFSFERMSWIKTNFLWMMYRCGWASKKDQQRVLAVRISRTGFEEILSKAWTGAKQKAAKVPMRALEVRLQWDPDHTPKYGKCSRRAIQLGLKGEVLRKYGTEWVISITDITDFVQEQHRILYEKGEEYIVTARERVYTVEDAAVASQIELDSIEDEESESKATEQSSVDQEEGVSSCSS